ncbi:hypothetical protein V2I01_24390 [Micromonospora sp. BRA006-A]|nr:hypothetical protein [Micromonospora sp. BRA006-A]
MSLPGAARRVRAYGGQFLLLAVLTLVTALLITGVPRVADRLTGQGLTEYVAGQPVARRDLTYSTAPTAFPPSTRTAVTGHAAELAGIEGDARRGPGHRRPALVRRPDRARTAARPDTRPPRRA